MAYKILLVEDEKNLRSVIKLNLEMEGHEIAAFENGAQAWDKFQGGFYSLIILDVMLPGMDGFELCKNIRKVDKHTPVLFLTARGAAEDRITGLKLGADDYLAKPFHLEELLLRVKALIKRAAPQSNVKEMEEYSFGKNKINFRTFEIITANSEKKELGKKEMDLLKLLIEKKNEVVPRELILEKVWGYESAPSSRTVDNYIVTFRKYFEDDPKNPQYFHSIRSVGYKFTE
ncbi:MAG TPA: response regulator transcription factor [Bacteroidia bacterium]|jgi:two-component system alkaline phosphatase synthesis response regulator PhoP|nr:response regulator transcription factor [Bacteroidia bacterium]